jgi:hypothetical protein
LARNILIGYYAATIVFLVLDFGVGFNIRIAFLEPFPAWRAAYYGVLFLCLALVLWQPSLAIIVGGFESLVTLAALIISFGMRVILVTDVALDTGGGIVTVPEILNFLVSGGIAYVAWMRGIRELQP